MTARIDAPALTGVFRSAGEADWHAAVQRSGGLRAKHVTDDGIPVEPIYSRRVDAVPVLRSDVGGTWQVIQRIDAGSSLAAAAQAADDFGGGATGIEVAFAESVHPLASAMPTSSATDLIGALGPSLPEGSTLRVDAGPLTFAISGGFIELARQRSLHLVFAVDPLAIAAIRGEDAVGADWRQDLRRLADAFDGAVAIADGRLWHAGGASEVQELAATLATMVEYLRALGDAMPRQSLGRIGITLAADADQLVAIAKFRAMRLLVGRLAEVCDAGSARIAIHGETAWRMMSRREARMNILRAGGAAFAAAAGGADSISVLPFDSLGGPSTAAARRLARNTQIIFAEESHLARFADPAAGSGAIETLTDALAQAAWERFRRIEAGGGMAVAVRSGSLRQEIAATQQARLARMRNGGLRMVGVNAFTGGETHDRATSAPVAPSMAPSDNLLLTRLAEEWEGDS